MDELKQEVYRTLVDSVAKTISEKSLETLLVFNASLEITQEFADAVEIKLNSLDKKNPYTCIASDYESLAKRTYPYSPKRPNHRLCIFFVNPRQNQEENNSVDLGVISKSHQRV